MGLDRIVDVSITRETTAVTRAGFGTYGIIAEFATNKTTVTFDRYRIYGSIEELSDDGWTTADEIYNMANTLFSQNPKVAQVLVGRKDSGDADWAEALTAVQNASSDWYCFSIVASQAGTITFDADFVTSNLIDITVNGTAVTQVPFNTDNATTYADLKTQIETDITDSTATIDAVARTIVIEILNDSVDSITVVVTGGASQATGTVTYTNEDDYKAVAAWVATQKKIFIYASASEAIYDSGSTTDIASFMKSLSYDRVISCYHPNAEGGATPNYYMESGWPGKTLPYDVGQLTWAYKTITGVPTYTLTSGQETVVYGKNCNTYLTVAGVNITQVGKVASGEWIDIIRGVDALEARLQEDVFATLVNELKVPYTDAGITIIEGIVKKVLNDFADDGFLIKDSIVLTVPKYSEVDSADKIARHLPDVVFEATPQGAIHTVKITGTISF